MSKKIHTIQSSDKKEFDKTVNQFLESGCEHMPPQIPARDASLDLRQKNENNSRRRIGFSSR